MTGGSRGLKSGKEGAGSPADLHGPLARLLRPLVKLCIRNGMTFPALSQLLRELFVNVAEHDFALRDKEQTDSRVSLLTGIHRKEVARLRGAGAPVNETPGTLSLTSAIIARWIAARDFTDSQGRPRPLPRHAPDGPSFESLVASITKDVRPRAVLDEWLDRGVVRVDDEDRIVLVESAFVPRGSDERKWHYFGRNLHDHIAAAADNVSTPDPRFFERAVHYDGISRELAQRLEERSRQLAMEVLTTANKEANLGVEQGEAGNSRWNFGVYIYRDDPPDGDDESGRS